MNPPKGKRRGGFTVIELILVIVIFMLLASMALIFNQNEMRSADSQALVDEIAAWLGEIAMAPEDLNTSCTVTFQPGTNLWPTDTIATVEPASCAKASTLRVPGNRRQNPYQLGTSQNSWVFNQRGSLSASSTANASSTNTDIIIRVSVAGQPPLRCVRLSGIMGLVRFGVNSISGSVNGSATCSNWKRN